MAELLRSRWGPNLMKVRISKNLTQKCREQKMSDTPFSHAESLRIGTVDFVSPDEVKVLLDIEAPDAVALNAGGVRPFPRVNGYVLLPVDDGYLVGQIEWLTIERSAFLRDKGFMISVDRLTLSFTQDDLVPIGMLRSNPEKRSVIYFKEERMHYLRLVLQCYCLQKSSCIPSSSRGSEGMYVLALVRSQVMQRYA
jgi:hypothetical protein